MFYLAALVPPFFTAYYDFKLYQCKGDVVSLYALYQVRSPFAWVAWFYAIFAVVAILPYFFGTIFMPVNTPFSDFALYLYYYWGIMDLGLVWIYSVLFIVHMAQVKKQVGTMQQSPSKSHIGDLSELLQDNSPMSVKIVPAGPTQTY